MRVFDYLRCVTDIRTVADVKAAPRLWSIFLQQDIARLLLNVPWIEKSIRIEQNTRMHLKHAREIDAEVYCLYHGTDTRKCPVDGMHDYEGDLVLRVGKTSEEERFEECDAGIVGGCGACVKCDPEWWASNSDGPLKTKIDPLVTMTPEQIMNYIPATNEEIDAALERGRREAEAAFPRPGANLNNKETEK